ncbi:MAG: hypothetical protein WC466_06355 [Candidatus Izemoplasmatales bacterium]
MENNPKKLIMSLGASEQRKILFWFFAIIVIVSLFGYIFGWFSETAQVTKDEFGPQASLKKYEWFKDASAKLEQKKADIQIYEARIVQIQEDYKGVPRKDWDRIDKETVNQWETELAGIKLSYNQLAAEYNSQSSKFNWKPYKNEIPQTYTTYNIK